MTRWVPSYRRMPSPLHAARPAATSSFAAAFALLPLIYDHPLLLAASIGGIVAAGLAAGVGGELARAGALSVPLALLVLLVNPLVSREGETLLLRGGEVLGRRLDVTLEALAFGGVAGLRVLALGFAFALFAATVDPDELLRLFRRVSYRSALTASLATRLVPVLARDAGRRSEAARCRPTPPRRGAILRAVMAGTLDRAVDAAAALELRGYATARRAARTPVPWSRHDLRVAAGAAIVAVAALGAKAAGVGEFEAYPELRIATGSGEAALAALVLIGAAMPFAGRAARLGVARA